MSNRVGKDLDFSGVNGFSFGEINAEEASSVIKTGVNVDNVSRILKLCRILEEEDKFSGHRKWFVPGTPFGIESLPKHRAFFAAGKNYRERYFSAGNRCGKTIAGAYEVTCHATGLYPDWWEGHKFDHPTLGFATGDTSMTVRNIIQNELLGDQGKGTGMIPGELILGTTSKSGVSGAVDTIKVRHVSGGISTITLQSYEQKEKAFYGVKLDYVWMDELPKISLYAEAWLRLMSRRGLMIVTATPLDGLTPLVLNFYTKSDFLPAGAELPGIVKLAREDAAKARAEKGNVTDEEEIGRQKATILASWNDAPWLSEQDKREALESIPENERESRSKGLPTMGSGTVYPLALEEIICSDFHIPPHFKIVAGLDVGWNNTGAIFVAQNPDTGQCFAYSEYKRGKAEPVVHAEMLKQRGEWINVLIDPASTGSAQDDGRKIIAQYRKHGLRVQEAENAVEAGIYKVWEMFSTGQLKVFKSCLEFAKEYITYRRDLGGRLIKENDHVLDALRYAIMGLRFARQKPVKHKGTHGGVYGGTKYDT